MADPKAPELVAFPESLYSALGGGAVGSPCMVSLEMIRAALSAHGLAIVSEADKRVLAALARLNDAELVSMAQGGSNQQDIVGAELARRKP